MERKIVVVGAGFAGLWSALGARRLIDLHKAQTDADIRVILMAPTPNLVIRPRLYEENPADMSAPLGKLFAATGIRFVRGIVDTIRTEVQEVETVNMDGRRSTLSYDRLILAAGSRLARPDIPGLQEHTFSVDRIEEAAEFDAHLRHLASLPSTPARNTVVVAGGGFTGIELAAELPARLQSILGYTTDVRVIVVERADVIGPELGANPRPAIVQAFTELGVDMKLGAAITSIDSIGVVTDAGERIEAQTVVWTAGLEASKLTNQIPGEKDSLGRLHVDRNLRTLSCNEVFAAGDTAFAATDDEGHHALMSCQHALQLGRSAGHNAAADLLSIEMMPYSQPTYGTGLDLGPWGSVVTNGWDRQVLVSGQKAKRMKKFVNGVLIYPPNADPAEAFAIADPNWTPPVPYTA